MGGRSGQSINIGQNKQQSQIKNNYPNVQVNILGTRTNQFPNFTVNDYIALTGLPNDFDGEVNINFTVNGAGITVEGDDGKFFMGRGININDKIIENAVFEIQDDSKFKGQGAEIFNNQVQQAQKDGFLKIKTTAARDDEYVGYYVWARLGYEPNNPQLGVSKFNEYAEKNGLGKVNSFKEIMATKVGQDYWKDKGDSFDGNFDLSKDSYSMKTITNYIKNKKQQ